MGVDTIRELVVYVIAQHCDVAVEKITDELTLKDLGMDSPAIVNLSFNLEDEFEIDLLDVIEPTVLVGSIVKEVKTLHDPLV